MWNKFERSADTSGGRNAIRKNMAGPRSRPAVVNRRRAVRGGDTPTATRRSGGRVTTIIDSKPVAPPMPKRVRPEEPPEVIAAKARWVELTGKLSSRDGKPYYPDRIYAEGDVILHKRHGMGVVESVVHEEAVMVLFRNGQEVVQMGQAPTR